VARGEALSLREQEYIKAAKALGAKDNNIILSHVLPNAITPILVLGTIQIAAIILLESALSFLGFSGTTLSWGFDISQGRAYITSGQWWIATMPGIAIVLAVVGINLLGDWLRDALDPGIEGEGGGV
jgi:peptide/nickel transport system permease protein